MNKLTINNLYSLTRGREMLFKKLKTFVISNINSWLLCTIYNLRSNKKSNITVEETLVNVSAYFHIFQYKYPDLISYEAQCWDAGNCYTNHFEITECIITKKWIILKFLKLCHYLLITIKHMLHNTKNWK